MSGTKQEQQDSKFGLPTYKHPPKYESDKGDDSMYPFQKLDFNVRDIEDRYDGIKGPLTLFAPYPHEDGPHFTDYDDPKGKNSVKFEDDEQDEMDEKDDEDEPPDEVQHMERPITPIDLEIRAPPAHCSRLAQLVRRRITPKPDLVHLTEEEQKDLAAIIMGEVNGIWPQMRMQVDDPFLTAAENRELQRRITVHIVTVCEYLFQHYLQKAHILQGRGVFSSPANMSRLKAQLALDTNKFLNILTVRRYIVSDLKDERKETSDSDTEFGLPQKPPPKKAPMAALSNKRLIEASRPKSKTRHKKYVTIEEAIDEMEESMPPLDTAKLVPLMLDLPEPRSPSKLSEDVTYGNQQKAGGKDSKRKTSSDLCREKLTLRKADSVPLLHFGETLFEELGIEADGRDTSRSLADMDVPPATYCTDDKVKRPVTAVVAPEPGTWEYQQADLQRLIGRGTDTSASDPHTSEEEDLPPLLQALTTTSEQESRMAALEQRLQLLEQQEQERQQLERVEIHPPTHPQPATVATKLPNKMVARTSDIRVSDRICLSSITLKKHATVYNDLIDEIDPSMVKKLDSNLFFSEEITEVFKELMKTVPVDHLDLENDEHMEPTADSINLSEVLASSTLSKPPAERVINPKLKQDSSPPWGDRELKDWARTPVSPPRDNKGRPLIHPMTPRGEGLAENELLANAGPPPAGPGGQDVPEVMARSYASWLQWWRNTLNSDDYMKYLSTQESDYLGVIFHFYNSDEEDDEGDDDHRRHNRSNVKRTKQSAVAVEKEEKLVGLRSQKTEYKEGFWNFNSILLGGLGKDPELEEEEQTARSKTAASVETSHTRGTKSRMVVSRRSQRQHLEADTNSPLKMSRDADRSTSRYTTTTSRAQSHAESNKASVGDELRDDDHEPTPQERLEKVWSMLQMLDAARLDMAIKYSSDMYHDKLEPAIDEWENAAELVLQREDIFGKLEEFERLASDPNRFFEKGARGSSVARLEESRQRTTIERRLGAVEQDLKQALEQLKKEFNDTLTYKGRPYGDKLRWDRTEMLYWLQEERKQQALDYESQLRVANTASPVVKMAHLDPIPHRQTAHVM